MTSPARPPIQVVAAAIGDERGRVLIARRPPDAHQGGLWEFPGGKLEPGETPHEGLRRELAEELGIRVEAARPLIRVQHDYGDRRVVLDVHRVTRFTGRPVGREGQPLDWVHPDRMDPGRFPAADRPVIHALQLPERLLITGPDPTRPTEFLARLARALAAGIRLVQLRAPQLDAAAYAQLTHLVYALCEGQGARLLLNADPALAADLPCHGLHLSATRLRAQAACRALPALPPGRWIGASCHDATELALTERLGLDYALLSPVRPTTSHPGASALGWSRFADLVAPIGRPVYALGGLGEADLPTAWAAGAQGIAAIGAFWPTADG
ncbi:Nudix family hydrolase [Thiococcus pfennigii]|uniref:Nudix family hydrolase n=1 Tax=Thiococcus pfennigii TaxID=1057 RepID=UPI0019061C6B|nr:Nudix family hydrolase [Thiococcus pfennigii]MBK1702464.1 thiamine monophosphate synthase [Thiococcus pfennigii]